MQNNGEKDAQRKGNSKSKDELKIKSQRKKTEEAKLAKKEAKQKETTSQRAKINIFGASQLKRLDETKLHNHHHQVKIMARVDPELDRQHKKSDNLTATLSWSTQEQMALTAALSDKIIKH